MQSIIDVRKNVPSGTIVINHLQRANAVPAFGWIQLKQALDDLHQENRCELSSSPEPVQSFQPVPTSINYRLN